MGFHNSQYASKEHEYELLDGCADGSSSQSPLLGAGTTAAQSPAGWSSPTSISASTSTFLPHWMRRNRKRITYVLIFLVGFLTVQLFLNVVFQPPAYVILEPKEYANTLEASLKESISAEQTTAIQALRDNLQRTREKYAWPADSTATTKEPQIPNTIFSSDKRAPEADWADMWKTMGFGTRFYDDAQAESWVEKHFNGTTVVAAWREMPRSIMRADMLRYLLLLLEGGTWSDMDTVPVMHYSNWSSPSATAALIHPTEKTRRTVSSSLARHHTIRRDGASTSLPPIRAVIGIECRPEWSSLRGFVEMINIKPINRHRSLQFVQWTIHMAPHHPIMLDVVRRILRTREVYHAYRIEQDRESNRMPWQWHGVSITREEEKQRPSMAAPWETISPQWIWTQGHWRLGWHATSVEEWTGPAVWTDAVVSYIYATSGMRPEAIAQISEPTQIGDLLLLPENGFAPPRNSATHPKRISRVVHLFRGSWKKGAGASDGLAQR